MSAPELITLHGGPADGRQIAWHGGDFLQLMEIPPVQMVVCMDRPPCAPLRDDRVTYRRSMGTRSAFVYQP